MARVHRLLILLCVAAVPGVVRAQPPAPPALHDVLERVGAYVRAFQRQLSGIVAEERYVQEVKYNIGNVQRTINVPVLALLMLDASNQPRFRFERRHDRKPKLGGEPKAWTTPRCG